MKKIFLNFADHLLSKEQMKNVTGGDWWDDYMAELARQAAQASNIPGGGSTTGGGSTGGGGYHSPGGSCVKNSSVTVTDPATGNTTIFESISFAPCGTPGYN